MNKVFLLFFLALSTLSFAQSTQRTKYNFNPDWKVFVGDPKSAEAPEFDDRSWKPVTLPYAWNGDDAFRKDIADIPTGIAWYRKHFRIPVASKGMKAMIEFEGIRQAGEFFVNGKSIGIHENGVMAFGFDITKFLNPAGVENIIAARIDNSWEYREKATNTKFQWEDKNFNANFGGISKNVYLHLIPKVYQTLPLFSNLGTTGVYIFADQFNIKAGSAMIHAESEIKNESESPQNIVYEVSLRDLEGQKIKTFAADNIMIAPGETKTVRAAASVSGLHFWSWGYGYLYNVQTKLIINGKADDIVSTKTGFRKTEFKDGMIYLNDRVMMVHGYAQRTSNEWPAIGLSVPAWLSDYSNGLMVEGNGNLVRWMHITPWKQDIESLDRVGLMQSMQAGDAEGDVTGTRWDQRKALMRDAIIYNRNSPSIIFYESGNKGIRESNMQDMIRIRDQYDPHGGRAIGSRDMLHSKTAEYGGEMLYTNKSAGKPVWAMEYSRDEGSRKYWDEFTPPFHKDGDGPMYKDAPAREYNRNMESHAVENVKRWFEFWNERPGTGKRVSAGGVNIVWSETNTHHRGEENYRRSGEVDALRIKKQNFYANQVMWDGWVSPEKPGIHIIGHWNYAAGVKKAIFVVSSADKVAMSVNGKEPVYGSKSDGFLFTFKGIKYEAGKIEAIGYDAKGKQICSARLNTIGVPVAIRLTNIKSPAGFIADGHDLALVEVEVVDAKGNRCPTALNMISYTLKGAAEWRGGMAMGPENYILAKTFPVENGVNRLLLRSTTMPGTVKVTANSEGLKAGSLTLTTKPFIVSNGLAEMLPSAGLPSKLEKGPTPSTPSYQVTRTPIKIVGGTAGANPDSIAFSYDDDETTDWVNDGKTSTAWIEYELEKPSTVNEISIKLNNFRTRIYPLIVTVDGRESFNGNTQTNLGYFTIHCKPQTGKKVRIQLGSGSADAIGDVGVEVSGKKLDDGVARDDANKKGTLSIIEAEIYQPIAEFFPPEKVRADFKQLLKRPAVAPRASVQKFTTDSVLIEKGYFYSEATEKVPFLIYKPVSNKTGKLPVVICLHGTGGNKDMPDIKNLLYRFSKLGFMAVGIDGRYFGERIKPGTKQNAYEMAITNAWRNTDSTKTTHPMFYDTAYDLWKLVDYLVTRPDVEPLRIGMTGISKGGIETWMAASVDTRIKVAVPVIATQSFKWSLENNRWQGRARTVWGAHTEAAHDLGDTGVNAASVTKLWTKILPGITGEFDCPSMIRLFAPRPLLLLSTENDQNCPLPGAQLAFDAATDAYQSQHALDKLKIDVQPNEPHRFTPKHLEMTLEWFKKWL